MKIVLSIKIHTDIFCFIKWFINSLIKSILSSEKHMPKLKYFDLIIRKGTVIDGTGAPRKLADIGIVENRIIEMIENCSVIMRRDVKCFYCK